MTSRYEIEIRKEGASLKIDANEFAKRITESHETDKVMSLLKQGVLDIGFGPFMLWYAQKSKRHLPADKVEFEKWLEHSKKRGYPYAVTKHKGGRFAVIWKEWHNAPKVDNSYGY